MVVPSALSPHRSMFDEDMESPLETASRQRASIRKFRGNQCPVLAWDGLRKDTDLWFEDGDCLIHLYAYGASQRGPSFRLPFSCVESLASGYLLDECIYIHHEDDSPSPVRYDVYVPAAAGLLRGDAYSYHLDTRNCFAFAAGLPVVGQRLGEALGQLWDRLLLWDCRLVNGPRFLKYCEVQGYLDFSSNTGHALAMLTAAEHLRHSSLYIDAFVHCVGMQDRLDFNPEYVGVSNQSRVLIERAALEMDLHISQVLQSMATFLEEELGAEHLGLTKPARDHLDRFRSCLTKFYVEKLGYYPPPAARPWKKRLWCSMYKSFQNLYDYLVDESSSTKYVDIGDSSENVYIVKNIQHFDRRHGFDPLPHPLPLLPNEAQPKSRVSTSDLSASIRHMRLSRLSQSSSANLSTVRKSLEAATNRQNPEVLDCDLVKEYQRFERQKVEEKLTSAEARNVRWLLIYSVLQMLTSVVRAPTEVRDPHSPPYPVCVLTTDCPPWSEEEESHSLMRDAFIAPLSIQIKTPKFRNSIVVDPVHDGETNLDDLASHKAPAIPARRRLPIVPILRTASTYSDSSASTNSPRQSSNGNSKRQSRVSFGAAQFVHPAFRNNSQDWEDPLSADASINSIDWASRRQAVSMIRSNSQASDSPSTASSTTSPSTRSSVNECESPVTDLSSVGDDTDHCDTPSRTSYEDQLYFHDRITKKGVATSGEQSVHIGCYKPTGFVDDQKHRRSVTFDLPRRNSVDSLASSIYSESTQQAADITEAELRGRQKLAAIVQTRDYEAALPYHLFASKA